MAGATDAAEKKKAPKFVNEVRVTNPKWNDSEGKAQGRSCMYDASHPDENVGTVADRFADQQGIPGTWTFQHNGRALNRESPMPKVKDNDSLALIPVTADEE